MYLTEDQLVRAAATLATSFRTARQTAARRVSIFLSHSHKDREIVQGLIQILRVDGVDVYVDWNDKDLPRITNRATATQIKKEIAARELFILLATRNAMESKWVPWEVGVADQIKTEAGVLIVPVADKSGVFHGNEYLQLYQRVEIATTGRYAVFAPGADRGDLLVEFLQRRAR